MEFDIVSITIGVVCTAILIMPFWLIIKSQSKAAKVSFLALNQLAESNNLKLDQHESWSSFYAIGIDNKSKKVAYVDTSKSSNLVINLTEVKGSDQSIKYRLIGEVKVFERLGLVFGFKDGRPDVLLEFFQNEGSLTLNGELQVLEAWHKLINSTIKLK